MEVRAETFGATVVLDLMGRLTVEEDAHGLDETVTSIGRFGPSDVVLNLSGVRQVDCAGIGYLLKVRDLARGFGARVALVNVDPLQRRLLTLFGLLGVLPVLDGRQVALMTAGTAGDRGRPTPSGPRNGSPPGMQRAGVVLAHAC
jgi:anti-anti-sigma factor